MPQHLLAEPGARLRLSFGARGCDQDRDLSRPRATRPGGGEAARESDCRRRVVREPFVVGGGECPSPLAKPLRAPPPDLPHRLDACAPRGGERVGDAVDVRNRALELGDLAGRLVAAWSAAVRVGHDDRCARRRHHADQPISEADKARRPVDGVVAVVAPRAVEVVALLPRDPHTDDVVASVGLQPERAHLQVSDEALPLAAGAVPLLHFEVHAGFAEDRLLPGLEGESRRAVAPTEHLPAHRLAVSGPDRVEIEPVDALGPRRGRGGLEASADPVERLLRSCAGDQIGLDRRTGSGPCGGSRTSRPARPARATQIRMRTPRRRASSRRRAPGRRASRRAHRPARPEAAHRSRGRPPGAGRPAAGTAGTDRVPSGTRRCGPSRRTG